MDKLLLLCATALWLSPFGWTFATSLGHYGELFRNAIFLSSLMNSLTTAFVTGLITVGVGSWSAYIMTRRPGKMKKAVLLMALMVGMVPQIAMAGPLFLALRWTRLINSIAGLVLVYTAFSMPLVLWFLYTQFDKIPKESDEAAALDGATLWKTFSAVILPQALQSVATAFVLVFLFVWNEFFFSLVFTIDERSQTLPKALALFTSRYETAWGEISAASSIAAIPVILLAGMTKRVFFRSS